MKRVKYGDEESKIWLDQTEVEKNLGVMISSDGAERPGCSGLLGKRVAHVVPSRQMQSHEHKQDQGKPPTAVHGEDQLDRATHTGVLRS